MGVDKLDPKALHTLSRIFESFLETLWQLCAANPLEAERGDERMERLRSSVVREGLPERSALVEVAAPGTNGHADTLVDLMPNRLSYTTITAEEAHTIVRQWEHSTGNVYERLNQIMVSTGRGQQSVLEVLRGEHPMTAGRPAKGAPTNLMRRYRPRPGREDVESLRADYRRIKHPTYVDVVRLAVRYNLGETTLTQILHGQHRFCEKIT